MTRRKRIGVVGAARTALRLAAVTAVVIVPRGAATQDAQPSDQATGAPANKGEPKFTSGIPGLKMADVRDHKHLWREIEELQVWEGGERISIAEYRHKVIEKTAHFLELDGAAAHEFATAASEAVATIRESFLRRRRASGDTVAGDPSATWSSGGAYFSEGPVSRETSVGDAQFYSDMGGAVTRVTSLLKNQPRHQLFAPECKQWLLKLAFGPTEAKEAKEAKPAQAGKSVKPR